MYLSLSIIYDILFLICHGIEIGFGDFGDWNLHSSFNRRVVV